MGLPLYIAPVESDIAAKPPHSPYAQARSTIRRLRQRTEATRQAAREIRRRALEVAATYQLNSDPWQLRSRSAGDEAGNAATNNTDGSHRPPDFTHDYVGNHSQASMDERVVALFGERWANRHSPSSSRPGRERAVDNTPQLLPVASRAPPAAPSGPWDRNGNSSRRGTALPHAPEPQPPRRLARSPPPRRQVYSRDMPRGTWLTRPAGGPRRVVTGVMRIGQQPNPVSLPPEGRFDGLGDRDRSLSPEGDGVWDTLLSTLTPDPQPPSVGSSFASASASQVASQTVTTGSSSTSLTGPDTADDSAFEHPCESGCENSDTEGDEDDEMATLTRYPSGMLRRRSYADVAAHAMSQDSGSAEPLELLGDIDSMQHIVRNLARREDIPDEWWAEAGLSRTLRREASN